MKGGVQVKICGITRLTDARLAVELGADFLGFIFYPNSSRCIDYETYRQLRAELPQAPRVYVQVRPEADELKQALEEGFDAFQIHFPADENRQTVGEWSAIVGAERLWLAPKIAPGNPFPEDLLPLARTFLLDTFREDSYGGTGATGDWDRFRAWSERWPEKRWILAGGLNPENIRSAVESAGLSFLDVNSGVEASPGRKDADRLRALFRSLEADG